MFNLLVSQRLFKPTSSKEQSLWFLVLPSEKISDHSMDRRRQLYAMLKETFLGLGSTLEPRMDESTLYEMGIDTTPYKLKEETEEGGMHFLPMSQTRLDTLEKRPLVRLSRWPRKRCSMPAAYDVHREIISQLLDSKDEDLFRAYEYSQWEPMG
jgi:hypothetical protein